MGFGSARSRAFCLVDGWPWHWSGSCFCPDPRPPRRRTGAVNLHASSPKFWEKNFWPSLGLRVVDYGFDESGPVVVG
jgi:hypothetical protein